MSSNFSKVSFDLNGGRSEFHNSLGLTGAEVSFNSLPAGAAVPFVHAHTANEEFYVVIEGQGELFIDGSVEKIKAGDAFRIAPEGKRAIRAAAESGIKYFCVQAKAGSLGGFTSEDGRMVTDVKAPWLA